MGVVKFNDRSKISSFVDNVELFLTIYPSHWYYLNFCSNSKMLASHQAWNIFFWFFLTDSSSVRKKDGLSYASMFNREKFQPSVRRPNPNSVFISPKLLWETNDNQNFLNLIFWGRLNLRTLISQVTVSLITQDLWLS